MQSVLLTYYLLTYYILTHYILTHYILTYYIMTYYILSYYGLLTTHLVEVLLLLQLTLALCDLLLQLEHGDLARLDLVRVRVRARGER